MEQIILTIDETGKITLQTKGFRGKKCMDAARFLQESLGEVTEHRKTGEYYAEELPEKVRVKANGK